MDYSNQQKLTNFLFESELQPRKKSKNWQNAPFFRKVTEEFVRELNESGILREGVILESRQLLEEGFWDSVQSGIGTVTGGIGKFLKKIGLKKEPEGYEQAQRIFNNVMARESNKKVKDLIDSIMKAVADEEKKRGTSEKNSVFPYNKTAEIFVKGCEMLASAYDTLKSSIEKKEIPAVAGNEMINALRVATEKFVRDVEREKGGIYSKFGAGGKKTGDIRVGQKAPSNQEVTENINSMIAGRLSDILFEQENKSGQTNLSDEQLEKILGDPKNQEKLEKLTSTKLPKIIAAAGLATGALGAFFMSDFFIDFIKFFFSNPDQIGGVTEKYLQLKEIPTNGKLTQTLHGMMKSQGISHPDIGNNPGSTIKDFKEFLGSLGGLNGKSGDIEAGRALWASACQNPAEAQKGLDLMLKMPDTSKFNQVIGASTKFSGLPGKPGFFVPASIVRLLVTGVKRVAPIVVKGGLTSTGATLLTAGTTIGPWLAGLGIGAAVVAGAVILVRKRAKTKSRLALLSDLKGQMTDAENPSADVTPPAPGEKIKIIITLSDDGATLSAPAGTSDGPNKTGTEESSGEKTETKVESKLYYNRKISEMLFEDASVDVIGKLTIDGKTESYHTFKLVNLAMDKYPAPKVANLDELPTAASNELKSKIEKVLNGFDVNSPNVSIEIRDSRKKKSKGKGGDDSGDEAVEFKKKGPIEVTITLFNNDRVKVSLRPEDRTAMMAINGQKVSSYDFDIEGTLPKLRVKPGVTDFRGLPRDYSDRLEDEIMRILDGFRFNDRMNKIMLQDRRTASTLKPAPTPAPKPASKKKKKKNESFTANNDNILSESAENDTVLFWKKIAGI